MGRVLWPIGVALATFLAFHAAIGNDFVDWFTDEQLLENPDFRGVTPSHLGWMFTTTRGMHYIPVTWMTYGLDYTLWGLSPAAFHRTNVLLHAINAALVFLLIRALLGPGRGNLWAAAAALLWSLHPLRVESVAWTMERRGLLSTLFVLGSLLAYLRLEDPPARRLGWSVGLFVLALLSKAWVMTLPALLLILDVTPLRRLTRENAPQILGEKALFGLPALAAAVTAVLAARPSMSSVESYGLLPRLLQSAYSLVFYVVKTVVPAGLSPLYPLGSGPDPADPRFWGSLAAVAAGVGLLAAAWKRVPWAAAAAACYAVLLFPGLGFTQYARHLTADRYSYLAMIPLSVVAAAGLSRLPRRAALPAAAVLLAALAFLSDRQTRVWRDGRTLWSHALAVDPSNVYAMVKLGEWHLEREELPEARRYLDDALRRTPDDPIALGNRGLAKLREGDNTGAMEDCTRALDLDPGHGPAWEHRARAQLQGGDEEGALKDLTEAIGRRVASADALSLRGWIRVQRRQLPEALEDLDRAVRMAPEDFDARLRRAVARRQAGDAAGSAEDATLANLLHPEAGAAAFIDAFLLAMTGDAPGARTRAKAAVEGSAPGSPIRRRAESLLESLGPGE